MEEKTQPTYAPDSSFFVVELFVLPDSMTSANAHQRNEAREKARFWACRVGLRSHSQRDTKTGKTRMATRLANSVEKWRRHPGLGGQSRASVVVDTHMLEVSNEFHAE